MFRFLFFLVFLRFIFSNFLLTPVFFCSVFRSRTFVGVWTPSPSSSSCLLPFLAPVPPPRWPPVNSHHAWPLSPVLRIFLSLLPPPLLPLRAPRRGQSWPCPLLRLPAHVWTSSAVGGWQAQYGTQMQARTQTPQRFEWTRSCVEVYIVAVVLMSLAVNVEDELRTSLLLLHSRVRGGNKAIISH